MFFDLRRRRLDAWPNVGLSKKRAQVLSTQRTGQGSDEFQSSLIDAGNLTDIEVMSVLDLQEDGFRSDDRVRVVRIGEDGRITFSMPEMVGQYVLIEEKEGHILLSPFDLRSDMLYNSSIAKLGSQLHFVPADSDALPEA